MRGVGKTQLAAAYTRAKLALGWRVVAWVDARNTGSLLAGLSAAAAAARLYGAGSAPGPADAGRALRDWLEANGDQCLLVFDDAQDPEVLAPFIPLGAAHVIITSTRQSMANLGTAVAVDVFGAEEALTFLTERTRLDDDVGAAELAAELGYLPLALGQAAAVIAGERLGYAGYLQHLRALPASEYFVPGGGRSCLQGFAKAALSLEAVRAADQAGVCAGVMEFMAVLSSAGVRRELLRSAGLAGVLARSDRHVATDLVDRALAELADRSILAFSPDGQTVSSHRLTARMVRAGLARRGRLTAVCRAAASVLEVRAKWLAGSQDRLAVRDIPQQVTALLENIAGTPAAADKPLARILLRLRALALSLLIELGDSAPQAIAEGEALAADLERLLGSDDPETLSARSSLATAYQAAGQTDEAIQLLEQILVARQWVLGSDHPDTRIAQQNLAVAYQATGRAGDAIPMAGLPPPGPAQDPGAVGRQYPPRDSDPGSRPDSVRESPEEPGTAMPEPQAADDREMQASSLRHPARPAPISTGRPIRRLLRASAITAAILVLAAAGGVALALSGTNSGGQRSGPAARGNGQAGNSTAAAVQMAAEWVSQQVSRNAIVGCDPQMCSALEAQGVPSANLLVLRADRTSPLGANVVVATPTVRSQFGSRLDSVYAPLVIAGFGSGQGQVNVRVLAPQGATAYLTALRRDVADRKAAGIQLVANRRIEVTAEARTQLAAGEVDSRLLIMLPALAAAYPIQILAFGDPGPDASPGVPLCSVYLSGSGRTAGVTTARYLSWLTSFVRAQLRPFTGTMVAFRQGGRPVMRVQFARPSPLGLLAQE